MCLFWFFLSSIIWIVFTTYCAFFTRIAFYRILCNYTCPPPVSSHLFYVRYWTAAVAVLFVLVLVARVSSSRLLLSSGLFRASDFVRVFFFGLSVGSFVTIPLVAGFFSTFIVRWFLLDARLAPFISFQWLCLAFSSVQGCSWAADFRRSSSLVY